MINILTAMGDIKINEELKREKNFKIIYPDIQYIEGILECLQENEDIDYIFINIKICENTELIKTIKKIKNINKKIKIVVIINENDSRIKQSLLKNEIYHVFYNNKFKKENIINLINKKDEKIKEGKKENIINFFFDKIINYKKTKRIYKRNKVICVLGNNGVGKSTFIYNMTKNINKEYKKILIIDFDIYNSNVHTLLNVNKYSKKIKENKDNYQNINKDIIKDFIIKVNNKIDLLSGLEILFKNNNKINIEIINYYINQIKNNYELIFIDTTSQYIFNYNKYIIKNCDSIIFLINPNLIGIEKAYRLLDYYHKNYYIKKEIINIIFYSTNKKVVIAKQILKYLFSDYKIKGFIKENKIRIFLNRETNNYKKIIKEL